MIISGHEILKFFNEQKPVAVWEIDRCTVNSIRNLRDDNGTPLWLPEPNYDDDPGKLLGIPISIAKDECFQLRVVFGDGTSKVAKWGDQNDKS